MINSILHGLISFIIDCVSFFTSPINSIIEEYVPVLSDIISSINNLISWLIKFVIYIASWLNFDSTFWTFLVATSTLILLIPLMTHSIKLALRWYRMIMP